MLWLYVLLDAVEQYFRLRARSFGLLLKQTVWVVTVTFCILFIILPTRARKLFGINTRIAELGVASGISALFFNSFGIGTLVFNSTSICYDSRVQTALIRVDSYILESIKTTKWLKMCLALELTELKDQTRLVQA